jgi:hypothetical protein
MLQVRRKSHDVIDVFYNAQCPLLKRHTISQSNRISSISHQQETNHCREANPRTNKQFIMHFKTIVAGFMVATAASAAPAKDLEARQASATCTVDTAIYCCDTFIPFNFFIFRGIGEGHCALRKSA